MSEQAAASPQNGADGVTDGFQHFLAPRADRIDRLVATEVTELSRSQARRLVEEGAVTVSGKTQRRPSHAVQPGTPIKVALPVLHNPLSSEAKERPPLQRLQAGHFVIVAGDQCEYGLTDVKNEGYHKKPTGFLVPKGSMLEWTMSRRCAGDHEHIHILGKEATAHAGAWSWELAKSMVSGALWDRAILVAHCLRGVLGKYRSRSPSATVRLSVEDLHVVCHQLLLRASEVDAFAGHGVAPGLLPNTVRVIHVVIDESSSIVEFRDV